MSARYGRSHPGKSKASTPAAVESYYQEGVQAAANGEMQMSLMMCVVQTFFSSSFRMITDTFLDNAA